MVSTCKVLWSARLNTSKVTENRLEDRSSQWEATKRSVGLSTVTVVNCHRPQRSTSTMVNGDCTTSHLHNVWRVRLDSRHHDVDRHRNTSLVVGVVWRQKSTTLWALSHLQSHIRTLAKLSLVTFLVTEPASFYYCWIYWMFERSNTYYIKYWKDIRLFCLFCRRLYSISSSDYGINN